MSARAAFALAGLLGLMGALPRPAQAGSLVFEVYGVRFTASSTSDSVGLTEIEEGQQVYAHCRWLTKSSDSQKVILSTAVPVSGVIRLDGGTLGGFSSKIEAGTYGGYGGEPFPGGKSGGKPWKAGVSGKHTLGCTVNGVTRTTTISVVKKTSVSAGQQTPGGGSPGMLAGSSMPTPTFTSPAPNQKFTLSAGLQVKLQALLPGAPFGGQASFAEYAKASPFVERWHIEFYKSGKTGTWAMEARIGQVEGLVTSLGFGLTLGGPQTSGWFQKHGPGHYRMKAFLSQSTSDGSSRINGPSRSVEFDVEAPVTYQMPTSPGSVKAVPPGVTPVTPPPVRVAPRPGPIPPQGQGAQAPATQAPAPDAGSPQQRRLGLPAR